VRDVDVGELGHALRELPEPGLHELLALQSRLVLAVFLEITEFHSFADFGGQRDVQLELELLDFACHLGDEFLEHARAS
jgi:hypothetical protein